MAAPKLCKNESGFWLLSRVKETANIESHHMLHKEGRCNFGHMAILAHIAALQTAQTKVNRVCCHMTKGGEVCAYVCSGASVFVSSQSSCPRWDRHQHIQAAQSYHFDEEKKRDHGHKFRGKGQKSNQPPTRNKHNQGEHANMQHNFCKCPYLLLKTFKHVCQAQFKHHFVVGATPSSLKTRVCEQEKVSEVEGQSTGR